ncbi:hypothetical protein JCM5296_000346 [Sporobolomyces johnsonii]
MRSHFALTALTLLSTFSVAAALSLTSPAALPLGARAVSTPSNVSLDKRTYCILGICLGSSTNYEIDVNNCGSKGHICPTKWANGGGSTCVSGVCGAGYCNSGFDFSWSSKTCQNVQSDPNNCGSLGNTCSFTNGIAGCSSGSCFLSGCSPGYEKTTTYAFLWFWPTTICTPVDMQTDVNNCGSAGHQCPSSVLHGSTPICQAGKCVTTCDSGYDWDSDLSFCRDVTNDMNNCGACGKSCSVSNGVATCSEGVCLVASCNLGYQEVDGVCSEIDTQSDTNNCGSVGRVCPSRYVNGGSGICLGGVCQTQCHPLYDFDFDFGFCRDTSHDLNNCGKCGQKCQIDGAVATSCRSGVCVATACHSGYTLKSGTCTHIDTRNDVNNCGSLGHCCQFSPSGADGVCQNGQCITTGCPSGHWLTNGACHKLHGSQSPHYWKKDKVLEAKALCPGVNEVACPILGSNSYAQAVAHHFSSPTEFSGIMAGAGGYECLDVTQALDSCGGCASTGEGQDCTKIRGAAGIGCEASKCVVYSCETGWKPSLSGDKCIRVRHLKPRSNSPSAARRHLAGRHALHHESARQ